MQKLIIKTILFILPFFLSFCMFYIFSTANKGDLIRIGYLIDNTKDYRKIFESEFSQNINFHYLSKQKKQSKFDILTIGDSFSDQNNYGYQNYLASNNMNVIHYDGLNINNSPLATLYGIINGDILDSINVKYIILESIEREFTLRGNNIEKTADISFIEIMEMPSEIVLNNSKIPMISLKSTISFPLFNFLYLFDDMAYYSEVYKTKLNKSMFSIDDNNLLFFRKDIDYLELNNNEEKVITLNVELNIIDSLLNTKGIKLIVLPAPDKYNAYYEFIVNKADYVEPLFFNYLNEQPKNYIYINSKKVINNAIGNFKDVYFYDDTHWSPIASKLIAEEIIYELSNDLD